MDLLTLKTQLDTLETRYQEWIEPVNQLYREKLFKLSDGALRQEVDRLKAEQLARLGYDPYAEMHRFLDEELCPAYLKASPRQRDEIRSVVTGGGILRALVGYVYSAAKRIHSPADGEWLLKGLAAAAIEHSRVDYRDTLLALAALYRAAEEAGIPPGPAFRKMPQRPITVAQIRNVLKKKGRVRNRA